MRDPFGRLDTADVRRLVVFSSLTMGGIGAVLLAGLFLMFGITGPAFIATAVGCVGILSIPPLTWIGLPVRGGAWIFVAVTLLACFYVALNPLSGVTDGLMTFLSVLMLFTGAALGVRALLAVGFISALGVIGVIFLDVSRLPIAIVHETPATVIATGVKQIGAILISVTLVYGGLRIFRRAMIEVSLARDEARRISAAKSSFLANTSHEIRTPLNGLLGMAQVLEATDLTPIQRRYLDTITESGRTLLAILNDVLDLSKVEAGQLDVVRAPTDIRALLSATIAPWRPSAEQKGLAMSLQIAADLPQLLEIDRVRVRQCIENLIANAISYTDAGSLRIHVHGRGAGAEHVLKIDVEDTGAGVPADALPGIFEPFRQVEHPDRQVRGGTGLGLAIVRNLAHLMGGDLTGVSEVGQGSTFTLTIKAPEAAGTSIAEAPPKALLLVDVNEESRKAARTMLEQTGRIVSEAEDLSDALAQGANARFDGVLIELDTPGVADASLLARLRRNVDGGERGIIFIGDEFEETALSKSLDLAHCVFVRKPVGQADLAAAADAIERKCATAPNGGPPPANPAPSALLSAAPPS